MTDGIYKVDSFRDEVWSFHKHGLDEGYRIGWDNLDDLYRIRLGGFTVVTGIPGHGKSEVMDGILVNLAHKFGWKFCYFSPENYPLSRHFVKLAEKYIGKPFKTGHGREGFTRADIESSMEWVNDHFTFLYPPEESIKLDNILALAERVVEAEGLHGMVIDPWNELEHTRPSGTSETDYISSSLSRIRRFARKHGIHVWVIAHPTKLPKDRESGKYLPPTPYDISGSANWRNKADYCLCVHRDDANANEATVYVQKIKFKEVGKIGAAVLTYDYPTGMFKDERAHCYSLPPKNGADDELPDFS